jgi:uncharacterized protein
LLMYKKAIKLALLIVLLSDANIAKSEQASFEQTMAAAEKGNADAQNALGLAYFSGLRGEENTPAAVSWFEKAAQQKHPAAMYNLGVLAYNGEVASTNKAKGVELIKEAAGAGNPDAQYMIGTMYQSGAITGARDFNQAYTYVSSAAHQGFPEAQNRLGYFYSNGLGVIKNDNIAHEWYLKAANAGLAKAQHNVGENYFFGVGVKKNEDIAISWYKKAAKSGFGDSKMKLASLARKHNHSERLEEYLPQAAVSNDGKATKILDIGAFASKDTSSIYDAAQPQASNAAINSYKEKIKSGSTTEQYELGMKYIRMGDNVEGMKWIETAAKSGHSQARWMIAKRNGSSRQSNAESIDEQRYINADWQLRRFDKK